MIFIIGLILIVLAIKQNSALLAILGILCCLVLV
jgi:hypothetical protein